MPRRFPPPWSINEMHGVCFIVCDKNGQQLGYFYYENKSGHQRTATNLLTRGERGRWRPTSPSCRIAPALGHG